MSGADLPEVVLAGTAAPAVARLLDVLGPLQRELQNLDRELVLVGGLAVAVRVASADRVTTDIDSVFDVSADDVATVAVLAAANVGEPAGPGAPQRRFVDGIAVDCIDTYDVADADLDGLDDKGALFVGAHRFACVSATLLALRADERVAEIRVAIPAALVATKLHAARYRPHGDKLGGDLLDLYQLLTRCDNVAMADALVAWPRLTGLIRVGVTELFIAKAANSAARITATGAITDIRDDDLTAAAELFVGLTD